MTNEWQPMKAIYTRHLGFSDRPSADVAVTIVGYVWGRSHDVGRYSDNQQECAMAICATADGALQSIPIANLRIEKPYDE